MNESSSKPGSPLHRSLNSMFLRMQEHLPHDRALRFTIAGGIATAFYLGDQRHTSDVDGFWNKPVSFPTRGLVVPLDYGKTKSLYFDGNDNPCMGLLHPDYDQRSTPWAFPEVKAFTVHVLSPVDLAVSKFSRFGDKDRADILALAEAGLFDRQDLQESFEEASRYYVGNLSWTRGHLEEVISEMGRDFPSLPDKIQKAKDGVATHRPQSRSIDAPARRTDQRPNR